MIITAEFKDFDEMVGFAKQLIGDTPAVVPKNTVAKVEGEVVDTPVQEENTKEYTLEEVRAALSVLTRNGKQKEVKELLTSFGAKNLSSIDSKDYAAVMEKAGSL